MYSVVSHTVKITSKVILFPMKQNLQCSNKKFPTVREPTSCLIVLLIKMCMGHRQREVRSIPSSKEESGK